MKETVLVPAKTPTARTPELNPLELRQREAIDAADKRVASDDLAMVAAHVVLLGVLAGSGILLRLVDASPGAAG